MKELCKKHKICIALAIYLIFLGMLVVFLIRPIILEAELKNEEIQKKIADQEIRQKKLAKLPAIREQFKMVQAEKEKIKVNLTRDNAVELIERIEKISEETGNKITIDILEDSLAKNVQSKSKELNKENGKSVITLPSDKYIAMEIKLLGGYNNLVAFVKKIENIEYYCNIVSLKLTKEPEKNLNQPSNPFEMKIVSEEISPVAEEKNNISSKIKVVFYLENK